MKNQMQANNNLEDLYLIENVLSGSKTSLENLILKYKDWIFNLALRMVLKPSDAEDVTQEIFIKIITHLNKYDKDKASFKTWLYRITVNHILNMKKRGYEANEINFSNYYDRMDFIQDREPEMTTKLKLLIEDTLINCVMATLVCLDRKSRLVIILGVIFNINSKEGSKLLEITPASFRKILSRSKKKIKNFMSTTCTMVNPKAKCRCHLKITELIYQGYRNPESLTYGKLNYDKLVKDVVGNKASKFLNSYFYKFNDLFQSHPYWNSPDMTNWLDETISSSDFKKIFNL